MLNNNMLLQKWCPKAIQIVLKFVKKMIPLPWIAFQKLTERRNAYV
jgi:hypothetical protein